MSFRFENLTIWKDARRLAVVIYRLTQTFPRQELYGLTDQLRRAVVSIALNIAEGADRKSDVEFIRFLRIALGSINELVTGLYIAVDLGYLSQRHFDQIYGELNVLATKINALVKKIKQ